MVDSRFIAIITTVIIVFAELVILLSSAVLVAPILGAIILLTIMIGIAWIVKSPPERIRHAY